MRGVVCIVMAARAVTLVTENPPEAYLSETKIVDASRRSWMNMGGQREAWALLRDKLKRGNVKCVSLGGSMMGAANCVDDWMLRRRGNLTDLELRARCSFVGQFSEQMREIYGHFEACENRAVGGTTTAGILPQLELAAGQPDLLIVDFSPNDAREPQDWAATNKNGGAAGGPASNAQVFAATEAMLRFFLEKRPETALLIVQGYCVRDLGGGPAQTGLAHERVTKAYGVAYLDFEGVLSRSCAEAWPRQSKVPGIRITHPPRPVHARVATAITHFVRDIIDVRVPQRHSYLEAPLAPKALVERYAVCQRQLARYSARELFSEDSTTPQALSEKPHPRPIRGDWTLREDRPGKPAWIATEAGSILDFDLQFGQSPRAVVVYTESYESFGTINLGFLGGTTSQTTPIDAFHADHTTQTQQLVLNVQQKTLQPTRYGVKGFAIEPHTNRTLRVTFSGRCTKPSRHGGCKFAIQYVSSC